VERAATKAIVTREARTAAESVTTDEAPRATPIPRDEAPAIIARPNPVSAAIGRHRAVSVDAVIILDPHTAGSAQRRRRIRTGRLLRIVAGRTVIGLGIVITRSAIVDRSAVTRVALIAVVARAAAIHIPPE
jgi:hypothetical protein